ncbi:hypothetical protein EDD11_007964 [Mortierella claussenii]|nr:hypothetical protein EDD11_007964 [Mortierella claussenii]
MSAATMPDSFLQLNHALHMWGKECPKDLKKDMDLFVGSEQFLDRPNVFFKGIEDSSEKWVSLIAASKLEETRAMLSERLQLDLPPLYEARNTTFSNVSPAPQMPLQVTYNNFEKGLSKLNKAIKNKHKIQGWTRELDRATEMISLGPQEGSGSGSPSSTSTLTTIEQTASASTDSWTSEIHPTTGPRLMTPQERSASQHGMWFISVDIESYELNHSLILEIGWSVYDSRIRKFVDKHYAISDYRHLKNGKYVADRRDRFLFGETVWASLRDSIAAFQDDLILAAKRNPEGVFALIAHDMTSDEGYLRKMGVQFPEKGMVKFDTLWLNGARTGETNMTGLGKLLDELDIENYCLHNAGNDAHYTLELFLWLTRNHAAQKAKAKAKKQRQPIFENGFVHSVGDATFV